MYMLYPDQQKSISYKNTFWKAPFYHYVTMFQMGKCS